LSVDCQVQEFGTLLGVLGDILPQKGHLTVHSRKSLVTVCSLVIKTHALIKVNLQHICKISRSHGEWTHQVHYQGFRPYAFQAHVHIDGPRLRNCFKIKISGRDSATYLLFYEFYECATNSLTLSLWHHAEHLQMICGQLGTTSEGVFS
jgi:hypothetical protein